VYQTLIKGHLIDSMFFIQASKGPFCPWPGHSKPGLSAVYVDVLALAAHCTVNNIYSKHPKYNAGLL
jgi:hypothetical protein